jgi:LPS-assembly protein
VLSPSQDLVVSPQFNASVNPFLNMTYRKRFYSGYVEARMGATYDKDFDIHGDRFGQATAKQLHPGQGRCSTSTRSGSGASRPSASRDELLFDEYDINDVYAQRGQFTSRRPSPDLADLRLAAGRPVLLLGLGRCRCRACASCRSTPPRASPTQFENSGAFPLIGPLIEGGGSRNRPCWAAACACSGSGVVLNRSESQFGEPPYSYPPTRARTASTAPAARLQADWRASLVLGPGLRVEPFAQARGDAYRVNDVFLSSSALAAGRHQTASTIRAAWAWPASI